jgi:hypothetical protein
MAVKVEQDVVQLEISVDNSILVEVLECKAHLSGVEPF